MDRFRSRLEGAGARGWAVVDDCEPNAIAAREPALATFARLNPEFNPPLSFPGSWTRTVAGTRSDSQVGESDGAEDVGFGGGQGDAEELAQDGGRRFGSAPPGGRLDRGHVLAQRAGGHPGQR